MATSVPDAVPGAGASPTLGLGRASVLAAGRGSGPDETRRHNLATILMAVHHEPGVTRAELTRLTGLNRSTVLKVMAELVEGGLVHEVSPSAHAGRGRPSAHVYPRRDLAALAIYPDLDAITVGLIGLGGALLGRVRRPAEGRTSMPEVVALARELADSLLAGAREPIAVLGVGAAVPGLVRAADGVVADAPHLEWRDEPFGEALAVEFGLPVEVRNDARAATVAETVFGAGRGVRDLVYLNGSYSGIGGGAVVGGSTLRGRDGFGGEIGHTRVDGGRQRCHCGRTGCLETEVNVTRLLKALGRESVDLAELDDAIAVARGDAALEAEIEHQVHVLAGKIGDLASVFNPERVVLGGALGSLHTAAPHLLADAVAADSFAPLAQGMELVRAELGARVHLVGAAEILFLTMLRDPAALRARAATARTVALAGR